MSKPKQTLCDVCHARPAFNHICYGDTGKSTNLCKECFESSAPAGVRQLTAKMRDAHCQYCDGQPCAGGTDTFALMTGRQSLKFMCMPCSMEHNRYILSLMRSEFSELSEHEQLELLGKLNDEADKHMKEWVSKRNSK